MESKISQCMLEILNECLQDSNLETVSKAELRKKYLEKTGLTKLPHKHKKLFNSLVNSAYINYVSNRTSTVDAGDKTENGEDCGGEKKESSDNWKLIMSSDSEEDITPGNIKENIISENFTNGENDIEETSGDAVKDNSERKKLLVNSSNISSGSIQENVVDGQLVNDIEMESSSDFDEKSLASTLNGFKKQRGKRTFISSSEDETFQRKPAKRNKVLKKTKRSSDSEDTITKLEDNKKTLKGIKNPLMKSSDSEDEPLSVCQKKSNSLTKSDESEDESLSKFVKKQFSNSEDESILPLTKNKAKVIDDSNRKKIKSETNVKIYGSQESMKLKNNSSDSEEEPLSKYGESNDSIHSDKSSISSSTKNLNSNNFSNSIESTSESEDESLAKYLKKKKSNSIDSSDSEDEPLHNLNKKKIHNSKDSKEKSNGKIVEGKVNHSLKKKRPVDSDDDFVEQKKFASAKKSNPVNFSVKSVKDSSDSEDEPLNKLSNKKTNNLNKSKKETVNKIVKGEVKHSLKKPLSNNKSKEKTLNKKRFVDSDDDDSDEQPIAILTKKSDPVNVSLKSVNNSSDSEDEPLNNLSNKRTGKMKDSLKKSLPINNSNEQTLKEKRFGGSDDDSNLSNQKKEKSIDGERDSLLSDSFEDEPLSNIKKEASNSIVSEEDARVSNKKNEKSFIDQKSVLLSDSSEDEPLSNMKKKADGSSDSEDDASASNKKKKKSVNEKTNTHLSDSSEDEPLAHMKKKADSSSDSEDEPLNKLSTKKSYKKRKNSESGSSSFIDENEEQPSKKNKSSKRKDANDSGKGKKRPSASENKIEHLKKYLRVAGIRISNYNKFFENCKTMKAKCEKMMSLLEKEGLKGRPTLEKCKKLRIKIETKREIAELDVSNILKEKSGRPKRFVCSDTTNYKKEEEESTPIKKFSRLQDIIDSEESD